MDGQMEVVDRCLEAYLSCFASEQPKEWSEWIHWAALWYNTTFHVSTGTTPFEVVYGRKPPIVGPRTDEEKIGAVSYKLKLPEGSRVHAIFHISQLKKAIEDYSAEPQLPDELEMEAEEGEEPEDLLAARSVMKEGHLEDKAAVSDGGNYRIIWPKTSERTKSAVWRTYVRKGAVSYKLKLPEGSRVHAIFHISQLKKAIEDYSAEPQLPDELEMEAEEGEEPEDLLAARSVMKEGQLAR
ncbi:uncharacterized protein [Cicer arietinum]|uniref:uncharacterized protein n=1 Tax=Cicer arietinum TaxID=3827 RepID=UPI003CC63F72